MKLNSGELNQRIDIYQNADTDNGSGGSIPGEVVYWATSAQVKPLRSLRTVQANQEELKPSFSFTVRNRNDKFVAEDMFLKWRGQVFTITSAEVDFVYKEWLTIIAKSVQLPQR